MKVRKESRYVYYSRHGLGIETLLRRYLRKTLSLSVEFELNLLYVIAGTELFASDTSDKGLGN